MKTVSATIQIDAPPEAADAVMNGPDRCHEWNALFPEASGQTADGRTFACTESGFGMLHAAITKRAQRR